MRPCSSYHKINVFEISRSDQRFQRPTILQGLFTTPKPWLFNFVYSVTLNFFILSAGNSNQRQTRQRLILQVLMAQLQMQQVGLFHHLNRSQVCQLVVQFHGRNSVNLLFIVLVLETPSSLGISSSLTVERVWRYFGTTHWP